MGGAVRSYEELVRRVRALDARPGVDVETIGEFDAGGKAYPLLLVRLGNLGPGRSNVLIVAGIHGDEPAGVEAALRFLESYDADDHLLSRFYFEVFPCNNPTGWELDTRENWRDIDLNREFAAHKPEPETAIIAVALEGKCFDLVFEMHEDVDSPGLYLYEIARHSRDHVGEKIIEAAEAMGYPVNRLDCIEGVSAKDGLIRHKKFDFGEMNVPQAIYIYRACGGHVLTIEPPASRLPLEDRVRITLTALRIALEAESSPAPP